MTKDGETVGTVSKASEMELHVEPQTGLSKSIRRRLGWAEQDQDTFSVSQSNVERITDDEIRLKK